MSKTQLRKGCAAGGPEPDEAESPAYSLDIEIDERHGVLRVYDPRTFQADRRGFCRRLLDAVAADPGFEKAVIDLDAASCCLEFDRRSATAQKMAEVFTAAVRQAAEASAADRRRWWRRTARWSMLTSYRTGEGVSSWETLDARPGRIRLRHRDEAGDPSRLAGLADSLTALDGIEECRVSPWFRTLTLSYRPGSPIAGQAVDVVEQALRDEVSAGPSADGIVPSIGGDSAGVEVAVASGFRRLQYLAMAGGSFALTLVGLVVPGIPTVPFLLATSYYLARSSPRLNDRLRRTVLFGPILVEWEQHHGLSVASKAKLTGLTVAIVAVTVALSAATPVVLVVILVIAMVSIFGIARLPGLPHEAAASLKPRRHVGLALPQP